MELVQIITSENTDLVPSKDFEVYNFASERSILEGYRSLINNFTIGFSSQLRDLISPVFKDFNYKVMVIADEGRETLKIKKAIILLSDKKIIDFVKNSLTQFNFNIEYDLLEEEPETLKETLFKQSGQFWCDQIHNYLKCEYNFQGITKLNVAGHAGELQMFNIGISGKGTTDEIIEKLIMVSQYVETNKAIYYAKPDDIFNVLEAYFKS